MSGRDRGGGGRGRGSGPGDRGRGGGTRGGDGGGRGGRGDFRGRGDRGGGGGRGGPSGPPAGLIYTPPDGVIPAPSASVAQAEAQYTKNLSSSGLPDIGGLQVGQRFPRRPGFGTKGTPIVLWANYFEFVPPPDLVLYRYSITEVKNQKGEVPVGKKLGQIVRLILEQPPLNERRDDIVTDFKTNLVSRTEITSSDIEALPREIQYRAEDEDEPRPLAPVYRYIFQATGTLSVSELTEFLTSTNPNATFDKQPISQALNIFLGNFAKASAQHTTIGANRSYKLDQAAVTSGNLGAGLTALRGFFSSVRVATARILVNVNMSHAPFYNAVPLFQSMDDFRKAYGPNRVKLQSFLRGVRVRTTHLPEKKSKAGVVIPRVKAIAGLAKMGDGAKQEHPPRILKGFGSGPQDVEFWLNDTTGSSKPGATPAEPAAKSTGKKQGKGKQPTASGGKYISVYDFFQTTHRVKMNPNYPVVNVGGPDNPSYLPVEVCVIMPGKSSQAKLDPDQTAAMITVAVRPPNVNAKSIAEESAGTVGLTQQSNVHMRQFGVTISAKMITVPGRVLGFPQVKYKNNQAPSMFPASWNQQDRNRQFIKFNAGGSLGSWGAMMIAMGNMPYAFNNPTQLNSTVTNFQQTLKDLGINAPAPQDSQIVRIADPDDPALETALTAPTQPSLLLVILPAKQAPLYNRIKHIGDTKAGVHTICVVGSKFANQRGQDKYFANVALKFNLKLGGTNQMIDGNKLGIINEDKTMVVGLDVTHPSPGSAEKAPSVAGMVASIDKTLGQWPAILSINPSRQEKVEGLTDMLKTRLSLWKIKGKHAELPENILIYRDGVSESQYDIVLNDELPLLRKACSELYPAASTKKGLPYMTIAVVGKRHHTRFYPTAVDKQTMDDKTGNCKHGTIVDRHVTEARNWDFFLQAHNALQGTARPAHYFVVLDEIFTKRKPPAGGNVADVLEDLTHNMCYLFGRATKAVSLCPPAYYADLVCERARCYLAGQFDMATPAQTESGDGQPSEADAGDILVHPKLKDTMFYI